MTNELIGTIETEASLVGTIETEASLVGTIGEQGSTTTNYNNLINKPSIESVELLGDKTFNDFGLLPMTLEEIENLL